MKNCIVDAGYKTPAIAKILIDDGVTSVFPYKRPMTQDEFSGNLSMYMMNAMMHTYVQVIISYTTALPTEKGIENTKVAEKSLILQIMMIICWLCAEKYEYLVRYTGILFLSRKVK